jgi:hypothetical protein
MKIQRVGIEFAINGKFRSLQIAMDGNQTLAR